MHGGLRDFYRRFQSQNLKRRDLVGVLGIYERIILKGSKQNRIWGMTWIQLILGKVCWVDFVNMVMNLQVP